MAVCVLSDERFLPCKEGHAEVSMYSPKSDDRGRDRALKDRLVLPATAILLAGMSLLRVEAHADDELLQFEAVNPQGGRRPGASIRAADAAVERAAGQLVRVSQSSSAQVIQSVRDSLAPLPRPRPEPAALQFEPVEAAVLTGPDAAMPVPSWPSRAVPAVPAAAPPRAAIVHEPPTVTANG